HTAWAMRVIRTAKGWVASSTRSAPPCPRNSPRLSSVNPRASTRTDPVSGPKRVARASARVTVARTSNPSSRRARARGGPSLVPLSRRIRFFTAARPEKVCVVFVVEPGPIPPPGQRPHQDQGGAHQLVVPDFRAQVLQLGQDDLLVRPGRPV